jgi:hypothetical protein
MKLPWRNRSQEPDDTPAPGVVLARPWIQLAARVGLWSLVALGAFGGLVGLVAATGSGHASSDPVAVGEAVETPAAVPGVAERAVRVWIEANEPRDLDGVFAVATQTRSGFSTRWVTRNAVTVAVDEIGDRYWAVTVAATVEEHSSGELVAVGERFVQVGVVETGGDLIAVTPVPFVSAAVERQAVDELSPTERRVRVRVRATTPAGSTRHLSYQLVLTERDGRWEINQVSGAPDIARSAATPTDQPKRERATIQFLTDKLGEVEVLVQAAIAVMAMIMVIAVWAKSKALVPTLGALLFGAFVVWGVDNTDILRPNIDEPDAMATSGTGTPCDFDETFDLPADTPSEIVLLAYDISARDGSRVDVTEVPLTVV